MNSRDEKLKKLVMSRQTKLESDRTPFEERMQEVADFVIPYRDDIRGTLTPGQQKGKKIFDGTAVGAAVLATDGIHGYHVSPAFPWFKYQMNRKQANEIPDVREWLDEVEFNIYMALNRSNFYTEMWSFIYDGFTLATAVLYAEEDIANDRIVFETVHPGEVYIQENRYGEIDVLHRKRKLTAKKLVEMFGLKTVPENVRNNYKNNPFTEHEVIHAVFPREEFDGRLKDSRNKRYASVWLLKQGNVLLREGGFDKFPYHVWRYMRTGKDPYGISPAYLAMADIKGINLLSKTLLGAAQLAVQPAYTVPSYLLGQTDLSPNGLNYVQNSGDKISPINTGSNYPVGTDREAAKQASIRERFHVDTFLMLASLEGRGQRTAYEVSEMMAEKAAILGAELAPFNVCLDSILDDIYNIEQEAAVPRMPIVPDILLEMHEADPALRFDPVYMGPLAQAQRERFQKDGLRKFIADFSAVVNLQAASGQGADVLDVVDFDEAARVLADSNRAPASVIRTPEQIQAMREARAQAMQQARMAQDAQSILEGIKTASEADRNLGGKLSGGLEALMAGGMAGGAEGAA